MKAANIFSSHTHERTTYLNAAKPFPFRTIVAATDFSEESSAALRCAQAIARRQRAMLLLIHVIDPVGYAFPEGTPTAISRDAAAREELARIETEVRQHGIPVHSKVETGLVCERILLSLRDHKAALLVLGTKAITGAGRAALGAVTRQLLTHSPCPILTVAPDEPGKPRDFEHWDNVLAATDFSAASLSALHYAQRVATRHLIVLHSARCGRYLDCPNCLERLRFLAPFDEAHGLPVDHVVTGGDPALVIIDTAERLSPNLIVLGAPSPAHDGNDLALSTVVRVITAVRAPVLIVPESRARLEDEVIEEVATASGKLVS
ncbi:MAG TPA: universal stress protein [Acidobacteriaceae bacterium]|jgi:nucleotide-binding universal stress UspA family protein|nr:universal stress protein [Acidobacteriaceae bacterium]